MKKNIGTQEAHIRTITGIVALLLALFLVDNPSFRILLAVIAAILAGTAYTRSCPINTLLKRNTHESFVEKEPIEDVAPENEKETSVVSETETTSPAEQVPEEETK